MIENKLLNINIILISILPIALISGPLISDLIVLYSFLIFFFIYKKNYLIFFKDIFFLLFLIFWLNSILSSSLSSDIIYSIKSSLFYIRFIVFFLVIAFIIKNYPEFLKKFYYVLIFAFSILFLDSSFQKIFDYNLIGMKTPHEIRISSFFGDELILGSFLVKFYPLLIGLTYFFNQKNFNLYFFLISICTFITVIISVEKTATIIFIIQYLALLIFLRNKLKYKYVLLLIPILIISFVFMFAPNIKNRIYNQLISNSKNFTVIYTQTHNEHYISSYRIFKDHPVLGIGPKMFRKYCGKEDYKISEFSCTTHPHNYSMQMLSETGLIGFFLYILIYSIFFIDFCKIFFKKNFSQYEFLFFTTLLLNLINFMPLFPSGNFFNNWLAITYSIPLGFYYYFRKNFVIK